MLGRRQAVPVGTAWPVAPQAAVVFGIAEFGSARTALPMSTFWPNTAIRIPARLAPDIASLR